MRNYHWKAVKQVQWKAEAKREFMKYDDFQALVDHMFKTGHLAATFNDRKEWMRPGVFAWENRGYWEHLYLGGPSGVRHIISNKIDDAQNVEAMTLGYVPDTGRRANTIEQRLFKEFNGVTEREAFGYSDPELNKCVPKQLYHVNSRWLNKKIDCAGKADFSSHYPANIKGPLPNWSKLKRVDGRVDPTPAYPFAFYTRSGHLAEFYSFDTHDWLDEDLCGDLFGAHHSKVKPEDDVTILCPEAPYRLDSTIDFLYNKKTLGESIDGMPAKTILVSSIGYKHLRGALNTRNRLYHLAAVCIARANQRMIDLYNKHRRSVLQIIVDGIIYMGAHKIGEDTKALGELHQELTDQSFIMRGANQYMFIDRQSGECTGCAHSGFDFNIQTSRLEDIQVWQRSRRES